MNPFEKYRRIKLAKARKANRNRIMTKEQAIKQEELNRKLRFIDQYKLTPLKNMQDLIALEEKTRAKVVIHCQGQQITLNPEQSIEVLREVGRCLMIERQQIVAELSNL